MALRFPAGGALDPEVLAAGPGLGTHFVGLLVADGVMLWQSLLTTGIATVTPNLVQMALNGVLAITFVVAALVWFALHVRRRVSRASGAGLVLAAYGLSARVWCEYLAYAGGGWIEVAPDGSTEVALLFVGRWIALFAVAFGLISSAALSVIELRDSRVARA